MQAWWFVVACVGCGCGESKSRTDPAPICEWLHDADDLAPGDGVAWLGTRVGYLYWLHKVDDRHDLLRVPIAGGEPDTIASGVQPVPPVLDSESVVWADARGIVRRRHTTLDVQLLDARATQVTRLRANGFAVYWRATGTSPVHRIPLRGEPTVLAGKIRDFVTDRGAVYWEEDNASGITIRGMNEMSLVDREILDGQQRLELVGASNGEVFATHFKDEDTGRELLAFEFMRGGIHPFVEHPRVVVQTAYRSQVVAPNGALVYTTHSRGIRFLVAESTRDGKTTTIAAYGPHASHVIAFDHEHVFQVVLRAADRQPRITRRRRCDVAGPAI